jgi:hypothetical protein
MRYIAFFFKALGAASSSHWPSRAVHHPHLGHAWSKMQISPMFIKMAGLDGIRGHSCNTPHSKNPWMSIPGFITNVSRLTGCSYPDFLGFDPFV